MSTWFRFYGDAVNDPKVQRLPGEKFKAWVNLLCLASKNDGVLPPLADVAYILRMSEDEISNLLNDFCSLGLLDLIEVEDAPMSYEPHNWKERQYKSDTKDPTSPLRQKAYRERIKDRNATVTVTPTRTDTEQIQITEQKKDAAEAAPVAPSEEADFYRRVKQIAGANAGGLGRQLLKAKQGNIALARAAIEQASTKHSPREYLGAIIRSREEDECRPDRSF